MMEKPIREIGSPMGKTKADEWVEAYQKQNPKAAVKGWLYGKDILETLGNYSGSEGIWFFKGLDEKGDEKLVMYPADKDGNILGGAENTEGGGNEPADDGTSCPPACPK